ncbi:hypothetical protein CSB66_2096 [Enterobacter hormaechei]|nr:hypothetical protein CSB66_2096 [Enterobacter hormaechei]
MRETWPTTTNFMSSATSESPIKKPHDGGYCLNIRVLLRFNPG